MHGINRRLVILGLGTAMAGCTASTTPHSVRPDTLRQFRIASLRVQGGELIRSWPAQEAAYARQANLSEEEAKRLGETMAGSVPALRQQMERALEALLSAQASNQLGSVFSGKTPAELVVTVKVFDIPSLVRRVLVDQHAKIQLDIDLVDTSSRQSVMLFSGPYSTQFLLGGLSSIAQQGIQGDASDPAPAMARNYIQDYARWLMAGNAG
jgi:hypothetical protein